MYKNKNLNVGEFQSIGDCFSEYIFRFSLATFKVL